MRKPKEYGGLRSIEAELALTGRWENGQNSQKMHRMRKERNRL